MKKIILAIIVIALILAIVFVFAIPKEQTSIMLIQGDQEQVVIKDFIYDHTDSVTFPAVVRASGKKPVTTEYKGVEMSSFFDSLSIDTSNIEKITFNATDGYRIVIGKTEIDKPDNVYLTFERDGEYMKSKKQGGNGPFQLVIREDPFSQRWIKHVDTIILE